MKQRLIWLGPEDEDALRILVQRYGCESVSQAIRLAIRVLAASPILQVDLPPTPKHARKKYQEEK
jgi:hypothetical protein